MKIELYVNLPYTSNFDSFLSAIVEKNKKDGHYSWNKGLGRLKNIQVRRLQKLLFHYGLSLYVFHALIEFDKEQFYRKEILYPMLLDAITGAGNEEERKRNVYSSVIYALLKSGSSIPFAESTFDWEKLRNDCAVLSSLIISSLENPADEIELKEVIAVLNMEMEEKNITLTALRRKIIADKDYTQMKAILRGKQNSCGDMQILLLSAALDTLPSSVFRKAGERTRKKSRQS